MAILWYNKFKNNNEWCSAVSASCSRLWKKLPLVALNLRLYESQQQEEKSKPISRYPVPYEKDLPFDLWELLEEIEKKTGFLPNVFKVLSHRPLEFKAFFAYYDTICNKKTGLYQLEKVWPPCPGKGNAEICTCYFPSWWHNRWPFQKARGAWLQPGRCLGYSCNFSFLCHVQPPCSFCQSCSQQRILFDGQNQWCQRDQEWTCCS